MRILSLIAVLAIAIMISSPLYAQSPKRELRAAWIATVNNIDWPSKPGLSSYEQKAEYIQLLDKLQAAGMNAVIMQIRPTADSFYPSSYEPWSAYLTGTQGQAPQPYYNPLQFMIEEAKNRNMEFHAWFNPYRASNSKNFIPAPSHPMVSHPEWFVSYGGKWYYDPGIPEAREYVLNAIIEVVRHYDLDAVHFDDYFYPYKIAGEDFPDQQSFKKYGARFTEIEEWRRANVDYFVETLAERIKKEKPFVKFGISPFGVWRNKDKDPEGSATQAGQTNYDDLYADVLKWLREGWVDYITPQIYWHIGFELAEYKTLVQWWVEHSYGKHVYIGQGIYRLGQKGWEDKAEVINQITFNRSFEEVHGSMYFSARTIVEDKEKVSEQFKVLYPTPAIPPLMPWLESTLPLAPSRPLAKGNPAEGLALSWAGEADYFVIYRSESTAPDQPDSSLSSSILAKVRASPNGKHHWIDHNVEKHKEYSYIITGFNRLHKESKPSPPIWVKTKGTNKAIKLVKE
ncbi:UPF0748 protein YngK [Echinicola pacifica]|uniref:UPF0748 protein YngK n=1 Tax=Echinicola pacifica TaxID=346377 RepID=A0A918URM6_9BACT|nr:family 10 glycosylhydrolase [Echinicola pacifica]GGZ28688.1 UPF0748 protein YngK [Echinicola pacifica]